MADEVQPDADSLARKWWSDADDLSLLTQVNNDLPFKHAKSTAKAWDSVAAKLLQAPSFARNGLDGKKASSRFFHLLRVHRKFQETSKYMSGVAQGETGKIVLLDELLQLYEKHTEQRKAERATATAEGKRKGSKSITHPQTSDASWSPPVGRTRRFN
ncbi:hypothetical protein H310_04289 [Aphanomyces invadans]|uniref:Uncharacterized protein n=1 Tax=Aphanomyces invadans TaxID=157072 RepID=A0A024UHL5_9STRA|nr:hypothetical protein H310_04289 [Aphanomyces invadans]ETW05357.1 hypothetical protein H310_04289 [Aphanomyces invadans]|eukprot:XP_008866795.1 hypothetical protein H310_04289 [Aphanomyces invadans]